MDSPQPRRRHNEESFSGSGFIRQEQERLTFRRLRRIATLIYVLAITLLCCAVAYQSTWIAVGGFVSGLAGWIMEPRPREPMNPS